MTAITEFCTRFEKSEIMIDCTDISEDEAKALAEVLEANTERRPHEHDISYARFIMKYSKDYRYLATDTDYNEVYMCRIPDDDREVISFDDFITPDERDSGFDLVFD